MKGEFIFTYGLFRDQSNHLLGKDAKFIVTSFVKGTLYRVSEFYPGYVKDGDNKVYGDIYRINSSVLSILDEYEGCEYTRIKIMTDAGIECWIYEYTCEIGESKVIEKGDWHLR
jgi:gamma-glutamylcyclotransferase (GGCT)/AIG2-like uncharacterized protein YtfP